MQRAQTAAGGRWLDVDPVRALWRLLTSVRFALMLIGVLAFAALLGVLIPQVPPEMRGNPAAEAAWLNVQEGKFGFMAVEFACTLAKRNKGKVHVVHVIEVRRSLPLDADLVAEAQRGEDILSQAEVVAKRQDFEIEGDLLQARDAGHAIVDEAIERQADAIILGVPFRRPFGEFEMGKVPAHVLRTAQCEVILLRMPAD